MSVAVITSVLTAVSAESFGVLVAVQRKVDFGEGESL